MIIWLPKESHSRFIEKVEDRAKEVICSLMGKYINSSREERGKIKGKEKAKEVSLPVEINLENDKKLLEKFKEECNKDKKLHENVLVDLIEMYNLRD
ncbi:MAG TPA: hypothetical protein VNN20_06565 [Thermodesulfobacteriota bacterium]|nr:hypothetical protein [Thermodesulfobacteriota bacterium]